MRRIGRRVRWRPRRACRSRRSAGSGGPSEASTTTREALRRACGRSPPCVPALPGRHRTRPIRQGWRPTSRSCCAPSRETPRTRRQRRGQAPTDRCVGMQLLAQDDPQDRRVGERRPRQKRGVLREPLPSPIHPGWCFLFRGSSEHLPFRSRAGPSGYRAPPVRGVSRGEHDGEDAPAVCLADQKSSAGAILLVSTHRKQIIEYFKHFDRSHVVSGKLIFVVFIEF
jgi:hypothetical protein